MLISEQIENIVDNLGLERQTNQCRKGYAKLMNGDLSVFETYNGDELVQAVIDEFKLINAPIEQTKQAIVGFTQNNRLIGVLMPSQTVYTTDIEMMSRTGYGLAYKQSNEMLLANIADSITQTIELTNLLQVEAYENQ